MGEHTGKPGSGDGGGDPRAEPSDGPSGPRPSERRVEPARESFPRPPRTVQRRDPRADPDDDEAPAPAASWGRVDVVQVERGSGGSGGSGGLGGSGGSGSGGSGLPDSERGGPDSLSNAALSLRRELAKLHQQAAAVERTIEDQRRERSDALERFDYAVAKAQESQDKLAQAETELDNLRRLHEAALEELQKIRAERDNLARAIETAKSTAEDLTRARAEAESLREAHDEALRAASKYEAELAEIRRREQAGAQKVSDNEAQLASFRERFERTNAELGQSREDTAHAKSEILRLKQEATTASEATAKAREETEHERKTSKDQLERLERTLAESRAAEEKLAIMQGDLTTARVDAAEARSENGRLERDLEAARHARDVNLERATMAERETEGVRKDAERLQRELETAASAAARAETRAVTAERAKSFVEDNVRQLRDEVTTAFARWRTIAPSVPPDSVPPPTRALPMSQAEPKAEPPEEAAPPEGPGDAALNSASEDAANDANEASPATKRGSGSFPPLTAEARPLSMRPAPASSPALSAAAAAHQRSQQAQQAQQQAQQNPPPLELDEDWAVPVPSSKPTAGGGAPNIPPIPPPPSLDGMSEQSPTSRSVPPPLPNRSRPPPLPPPLRRTIPPAVYPSVPPPTMATPMLSPTAPPPPLPAEASEPRPPSVRPPDEPSGVHILSRERDDLFERLSDPATCRAAAVDLRDHPEWLKGRPPLGLLTSLTEIDYDVEAPIFELARAWEREAITRALVASMRDEPDAKLREHGAWLLKHLGSPSALPALSELVKNDAEPPAVRRWLLEAIERLVASRSIGWREVSELVSTLVRHSDPSLRDGVIGVVAALDRSDEKRRLLIDLLRTDNDEIVLASAVHALASALPIDLDTAVTERLLGHPSARVQRSVMDFIERSKRAARNA